MQQIVQVLVSCSFSHSGHANCTCHVLAFVFVASTWTKSKRQAPHWADTSFTYPRDELLSSVG